MAELGPAFVVAGCITRADEVLLAQRNEPTSPQAHLKWELPGGKVKLEEAPHEALIREIAEELGVKIEIVRLLPHLQSNIYRTNRGTRHFVVVAFECVLSKGEQRPRPQDPSVQAVRWTKRTGVPLLDVLPGTVEFIESLQQLDTATYLAHDIYIRLEKSDPDNATPNYWELRAIRDLWQSFNLLERRGNMINRSSHYRLTRGIGEADIPDLIAERIRSLVQWGYRIVRSSDPRFLRIT